MGKFYVLVFLLCGFVWLFISCVDLCDLVWLYVCCVALCGFYRRGFLVFGDVFVECFVCRHFVATVVDLCCLSSVILLWYYYYFFAC